MNNACKVSVIIPVYNMAKYLDHSVANWTNQTLKDIEIIYVDDGSSDDSLHILKDKAKTNNRICVCALPANKGIYAARLCGIEKANGQYILFADADDTVLPETCEELAYVMDKTQVDILQYPIEVLNPNGLPEHDIKNTELWLTPYNGLKQGKDVFTICYRHRKHCWNLAGKIFKTELCKKVLSDITKDGLQNSYVRIAEDALLYFMLSYSAQSYKGLQRCKKYYQYYLGNGGCGHKNYTIQYFEHLCMQSQVSMQMKAFLASHGALDTYIDIIISIRQIFLNNVVGSWINNLTRQDKVTGFDLMLQYWNSDEIIGKLAELRFDDCASIAKQIQGATSLEYDRHPIKTIATYYHRIANGGVERVLCQLCCIWQAMGYKVIVLTDKAPCKDDFELPSGVQRIIIPDFEDITPQSYFKRASMIQRLIKDYQIDAVVYHAWVNRLLFWDELAIKTAGAAFILHCHGIFPLNMLWNNKYDNNVVSSIIMDAVVTLSDTDYAFWKYYNNNVHVTINPLTEDINKWHPKQFTSNHKILWLGRLDPCQKNPLDILPIMQEVIKEVPDATLTIVGKSENGILETELQKQITNLHLQNHVTYAGFHKDVRPWFLSSQIFLMTSSYEGYPMTLQESKMAAIPCVMYELPYLILCEENRGIIAVPQRNTQAAAQAIIKLLQDDTLCAQYGSDARAHIEELANFDFKKKWQQIFKSIEYTHNPVVSNTEKLMMNTLIDYHVKAMQNMQCQYKSNQTRHGSSIIKRAARAIVPDRIKPYLKDILHCIPQGIKSPIKRFIRW